MNGTNSHSFLFDLSNYYLVYRIIFVAYKQEVLDKTTFDCLWNGLAVVLNYIGPAEHTTTEWKRIWSDREGTELSDRSGI